MGCEAMFSLLRTAPGAVAAWQEGTRRLELRETDSKGAKRWKKVCDLRGWWAGHCREEFRHS